MRERIQEEEKKRNWRILLFIYYCPSEGDRATLGRRFSARSRQIILFLFIYLIVRFAHEHCNTTSDLSRLQNHGGIILLSV